MKRERYDEDERGRTKRMDTKETTAKRRQTRIMTTMTEKMRRETVKRVETNERTERRMEEGGRGCGLGYLGTADEPEVVSASLSSFAKYRRHFLASHVYVHRLPTYLIVR